MTSRINDSNQNIAPYEAPVAKPLAELPKQERRKITTELLRIHNMVNALEADNHKQSNDDKSDSIPRE